MAATNNQQDAVSDDFDFDIWSPATKTTLLEKGLWDVVENGVPLMDPELAKKIQPEELSRLKDLMVKDMKALQIMQSSLPSSVFRKTLSSSTSKEVWDLLQKDGNNEEAKIRRLEKQFEEVKKDEKESLDAYVDRVLEINEQLKRLNILKTDYQLCNKLFSSLSKSYRIIDLILKELMEVHHVTAMTLVKYFYHNGFEFDTVTEEVFLGILKDVRRKYTSEIWCDVCFKNDHKKEHCKISIAEYKVSADLATLGGKTCDDDIWIVYGTSSHMTPYEKYFTALDRTHEAVVELEDGTLLPVKGRGDVKIKMKGGKTKTIKNVLFVPGFSRNVLSIYILASRGYSFTTDVTTGKCIVHDRTKDELGETLLLAADDRALALRLNVIQGNLTS